MIKQNIRIRLIVFNGNKVLLMHDSGVGFYFYPGGHIEPGETVLEGAKRECLEECSTEFVFEKILYIRDYFDKEEYALELFLLGRLKDNRVDNTSDPSGRKTQRLEWVEIDNLPKNLFPKTLSQKLADDFKKKFPTQGEYLGVIE